MAQIISFRTGKVIERSTAPLQITSRKRGESAAKDQRLAMLGKIHIALLGNKKTNTLGLFDTLEGFTRDVYEFTLQERYGVTSSSQLNNAQLHELILYLKTLGFKAKRGHMRKNAPETLFNDTTNMNREARMGKIEAMLAEKGRAEGTDVPWGYAVSILKRQTANCQNGQVSSFEKATPTQLDDVIAALYRDARRKNRRVR